MDEKLYQDDIKKAKLDSLKGPDQGESSKQGENRGLIESFERQALQNEYDEYRDAKEARKQAIRQFNSIVDKLDREGDSMDKEFKEYLINESVKVKNAVDHYTNHAQNLKNALDINSSEEEFTSESSSEES